MEIAFQRRIVPYIRERQCTRRSARAIGDDGGVVLTLDVLQRLGAAKRILGSVRSRERALNRQPRSRSVTKATRTRSLYAKVEEGTLDGSSGTPSHNDTSP